MPILLGQKINRYMKQLSRIHKLPLLLLLFCSAAQFIVAQTVYDDIHNKYWFYRWRLVNNFMKIGLDSGMSIPAGRRKSIPRNMMGWGEGTTYQGRYIMVLATEYRLLMDNGQDEAAKASLAELYYAMKAIERLDIYGNEAVPYLQEPELDGHVIRDDVREDFVKNHLAHFNQTGFGLDTVDTLVSDYTADGLNANDEPRNKDKDMSQDQVIHMCLGLLAVLKALPDGPLSFTALNGNSIAYDFTDNAKKIARRIIRRTRNLKLGLDTWFIQTPNGELARRGAEAIGFSFPLAKTFEEFNNGLPLFAPFAYNYGRTIWQAGQYLDTLKQDNLTMFGILIDMTDSYRLTVFLPGSFLLPRPVYLPINTSYKWLRENSPKWDWEPFYLPTWKWLNDKSKNIDWVFPKALDHLRSAPCQGPYELDANTFSGQGWAADRRYCRNSVEQNTGKEMGYYNGIDYMLAHNLYYLESGNGALRRYQNKIARVNISENFPLHVNGTTYGALPANHYEYGAFTTISASNTMYANGNVTYRAGRTITLQPGFRAVSGCFFRAYINPFECRTDSLGFTKHSAAGRSGSYGMAPDYYSVVQDPGNREAPPAGSERTVVAAQGKSTTLRLFPNPSEGQIRLRLRCTAKAAEIRVSLRDLLGGIVLQRSYAYESEFTATLDLGPVPPGTYLVQVIVGKQVYMQRISHR